MLQCSFKKKKTCLMFYSVRIDAKVLIAFKVKRGRGVREHRGVTSRKKNHNCTNISIKRRFVNKQRWPT